MKIILVFETLQNSDNIEHIEKVIKKHFENSSNIFNGKLEFYRNLGNTYGDIDLIIQLKKIKIIKEFEEKTDLEISEINYTEMAEGFEIKIRNVI